MSWQILFATASSQISGPLAAIASPCNQRLQAFNASCTCPIPIRSRSIFSSEPLYPILAPFKEQNTLTRRKQCPIYASSRLGPPLPLHCPNHHHQMTCPVAFLFLPLPRVQCRLPSLPPSMSGGQDLGPCRWIATVERDHSSAMTFYRVQDVLLDKSASACWGVERWMFRFLHDHRCRCRASLRTRAQVHARYAEKYPSSGKKDA